MYKLIFNFLVGGEWEEDTYDIRDRIPEKGDKIYQVKGRTYIVMDVVEVENEYNIYNVYLDN